MISSTCLFRASALALQQWCAVMAYSAALYSYTMSFDPFVDSLDPDPSRYPHS